MKKKFCEIPQECGDPHVVDIIRKRRREIERNRAEEKGKSSTPKEMIYSESDKVIVISSEYAPLYYKIPH